MDPRRRRELTRYGAPAAFLAAATIAVLLIKAGLSGGSGATTTVGALPTGTTTRATQTRSTTTITTSTTPITTPTTSTTAAPRYYTIQSGDTLGSVALREHTTVDDLLRLNPGVNPQGLRVGQRIRVG
ncbi:MAG: LysM peptidoglycan-binding domain-containing protein [Actinobacteria bacterium]|nr:MAG: LysM peptidoglycan-binding domain-containing protein [Actinomycetota bacterium]